MQKTFIRAKKVNDINLICPNCKTGEFLYEHTTDGIGSHASIYCYGCGNTMDRPMEKGIPKAKGGNNGK